MANKTNKSLADALFPGDIEDEYSDSILTIPPEQRRLHTETYDFAVSTILDYLRNGNIYIPEFQRRYVWNDSQASRLIESLIIQCPIPVIYLSQDRNEKLSVIDGNQRLTSLRRYVDGEFALKGLTAYPELKDSLFSQLDPRFQRHILNRTLRCIVIAKDTHPQVKFDVFERLNSGSAKLTPQELRHGVYHGSLMRLATRLAKGKAWRSLVSTGTSNRMREEELVIRFFAMHYDLEKYTKPLSAFLNDFSERNQNMSDSQCREYDRLFAETVSAVTRLYGKLAFRIFDASRTPRSPFNAALFDAEMLSISRSNILVKDIDEASRIRFLEGLREKFSDDAFSKAITRATSDVNPLRLRVDELTKLIRHHANELH